MKRSAEQELEITDHSMKSHFTNGDSESSVFSRSGSVFEKSRVQSSSETRSEVSRSQRSSDATQTAENNLNRGSSGSYKSEKQSAGKKKQSILINLDTGEKRLKKQLSVRFKKKKLSALPKLPSLEEFRNNTIVIHHAERGTLHDKYNGVIEPNRTAAGGNVSETPSTSKSASPPRHSNRRGGNEMRQARQSKSQPSLLPTIEESIEIPEHRSNDDKMEKGSSLISRKPAVPSLVDAYKKMSFAQPINAGGSANVPLELGPARSVWRTLPMQSELDNYISYLKVSKRQTHSFSEHIMPGLGFSRGGPIARPHSGSKPNQFQRQRTRFGDDVLWAQNENGRKKTTAAKLKSAQGRTDKLYSELKNMLEKK